MQTFNEISIVNCWCGLSHRNNVLSLTIINLHAIANA